MALFLQGNAKQIIYETCYMVFFSCLLGCLGESCSGRYIRRKCKWIIIIVDFFL